MGWRRCWLLLTNLISAKLKGFGQLTLFSVMTSFRQLTVMTLMTKLSSNLTKVTVLAPGQTPELLLAQIPELVQELVPELVLTVMGSTMTFFSVMMSFRQLTVLTKLNYPKLTLFSVMTS
jgi:hypothetical protein